MRISDWSSDVCSSDLDASGVAKMTLYHHFKSKNDIIAATLDTRRAQRLEGIQAAMAQARTPRHQILAAFDYLAEIIEDSTFRGCAFINATVELAEPAHPASLISTQHKQRMLEEFERGIGRASCRERVCPYVKLQVGAEALKKKTYITIRS